MVSKALQILYLEKTEQNDETVYVEKVRCVVNKWQFQDSVMGEQFITFKISSEAPIEFSVGDYCVYRGETFTLNYQPSVTQKAKRNQTGDAFTYDMVKFDSCREELTRATMLDITPTTGDYIAALGTNYTGSDEFQLFCGETTANGMTLTPVCALAAKMQANLDRAFPHAGWKVYVDITSTHTVNGVEVLNTHTDDKVLTFNNTTISSALSEVHNTFDLDFVVKGRNIYIGYSFDTLTEEGDSFFYFGYGKGYADMEHQGRGLFQIKKTSNSNQKIVTRLRAIGSKKNLPYRYYNNKYGLSQALFPLNLQLPDTFETPNVKSQNNITRKTLYPYIRDVKGDTNDAYIEKNDDCYSTIEGLREEGAKWDGSNSELEEIYPTIKEATYGELRAALCKDQDGVSTPSRSFPNYEKNERIDAILKVEEDANVGNGIMPDSNTSSETKSVRNINFTNLKLDKDQISYDGKYKGRETTLFTIESQSAGYYILAPSQYHVWYGVKYDLDRHSSSLVRTCMAGYRIIIYATPKSTKKEVKIGTYQSSLVSISSRDSESTEFELPNLPDVTEAEPQIKQIRLTEVSDVRVAFLPIFSGIDRSLDQYHFDYYIGYSKETDASIVDFKPEYVWDRADSASTFMNTPFHVVVKDMGFDFVAAYNTGEDPVVSMTSGRCVAREFKISDNPEKVVVTKDGKEYKGWRLTLSRTEDSNLHTYYPSGNSPLEANDTFVLLNIEMPEVYIKMAEVRLLIAATNYLRDNCETQFSYVPSLNDIFLQQNFDAMNKSGHPEKSIYWKLYAGLKFPFYGIPDTKVADADEILPLVNVTIETITIKEGEGITPKVDLKLNSDVQQSTMQRITTAVDRIYNGSIFGNGGSGGGGGIDLAQLRTMIYQICSERYLSRLNDDTASGKIGLKRGATFGQKFNHGYAGGLGAQVDEEGNAEFESIMSRRWIETPEFRFNRVDVVCGEQWNAPAFGLIESVDTAKQVVNLKLEDGELSGITINDICRGLFHYENGGNSESNYIDQCGFTELAGFSTSYFTPIEVYENGASFKYALRPGTHVHPNAGMKFAVYGNFTNKERQASHYSTKEYDRYLCNVDTWVIDPDKHIYKQDGLLEGLVINGFEMHGYGSYSHNNYFSGVNIQFDRTVIEDLKPDVYSVHLSSYECAVLVDIEGNVVEGSSDTVNIVTGAKNVTANGEDEDADNVVTSRNKWFTVIQAHLHETPLLYADAVQEDRFVATLDNVGCNAVIENGVVYVTEIDTTAEEHYVDIHVNCEGNATYDQRFNITLIPQPEDNVSVDLDEEMKTFASDDKGNVTAFEEFETHVRMWYGNTKRMYITKAVLTFLPDGISTNATIEEDTNHESSLVIPIDDTHSFATLRIKEFKQEAAPLNNIIITVTGKLDEEAKKTFTKSTSFKLNKALMGENAINFDLAPSVNQVLIDAKKNSDNGSVNCYVVGKDGKNVFNVNTDALLAKYRLAMKVRLFNADSESSKEIAYSPATTFKLGESSIDGKNFTNSSLRLVFYLYYTNEDGVVILIDKEGVPVVKDGVGYVGTEEYYALSESNETAPSGWNNKVNGKYAPKSPWTKEKPSKTVDSSTPYLWNFEVATFTEGTQQITTPICIGNFARGIAEVLEYYAVSNNSKKKISDGTPAGTDIEAWSTDVDSIAPTNEKPYLWNKTVTVYNDSLNDEGKKASTLETLSGQKWNESTCDVIYHVCAVKGQPGNSYGGFKEYYKFSDSGTMAPTFDEKDLDKNVTENGWSLGSIPAYTGGKNKYLWNAEVSTSTEYGDTYTGTEKTKVYIGCIGDFSKSIKSITEEYAVSQSNKESDAKSISKWHPASDGILPNETERYLWNRTTVKYSDDSDDDVTYHICLIKSVDVKTIEEYFKRSDSNTDYKGGYTADKRPDNTWQKGTAPDYNKDANIYLWNMEVTVLDDGTLSTTPPHCIGNFANGIKSIEQYYMLSTDGVNHPAENDSKWVKDVMPDIARDNFLWNKEVVTMLDDDTSISYHVIALYASDGKDAPLAVLSDTIVSVPCDLNGKVVAAFSEDIHLDLLLNGVTDIQPKTVTITSSKGTAYASVKNNNQQNKVYINVSVNKNATLTEDTIKVEITGYDSQKSVNDKNEEYYAERKGVAYFHIRRWKSGDGFIMEYYGPVAVTDTAPTASTYDNFTWSKTISKQVSQDKQCMYAALWSTNSNGDKKDLREVFLFARFGDHGTDYVGTTEYYALGSSNSEAPGTYPASGTYTKSQTISMSSDWSKDKPSKATSYDKPYLWNFEISEDSAGNKIVTEPICIGNFARGIAEVLEYYAISTEASLNDKVKTLTWSDEVTDAAPTDEKPYQWNKTVTAYNDSTKKNGKWVESTCDVFYHISAVKGTHGTNVTIVKKEITYAIGTDGVTVPSKFGSYPDTLNQGDWLWTKTYILYSDNNSTTAYSVSRIGIDGEGIDKTVVTYYKSTTQKDPSTIAEKDWVSLSKLGTLTVGEWLYTRTVITYLKSKESVTSYSIGRVGINGVSYMGTTEYYALGSSNSSAPNGCPSAGTYKNGTNPSIGSNWNVDKPEKSTNASTPYLWNFEISLDSDGNKVVTNAICIGNFSKGIIAIIEAYAISDQSTLNDKVKTLTWSDEVTDAAPTYAKPYQWNKSIIAYNDSTKNTDGSWDESTCDVHYHISAVRGNSAITFSILCVDTIKPGDTSIAVQILRTDSGSNTSEKKSLSDAYTKWSVELSASGLDNAEVLRNASTVKLSNSTITKTSYLDLTLKIGSNVVAEKHIRGIADGITPITIYYTSVKKPSTPSGSLSDLLNNGWSQTPVDKAGYVVKNNNVFSQDSDGYRKSPAIDDGGVTKETLTIVTTKANQAIGIKMKASSEDGYDYGIVGLLDNANISSYTGRVSGDNNIETFQVDIPTAGSHSLIIAYSKDYSTSNHNDCIYYKIIKPKVWKSVASFDADGNISSWSEPYTSDSDDGTNGTNGTNGKDSTSYWLDSIIGCIHFTHAGYSTPKNFNVSARKKTGEGNVEDASFYFKAFVYNGSTWSPATISWDGGSGNSFTNKKVSSITVNVSQTTDYKQYLIKAFDTQPTAATAATAQCVCEKAIGVAVDGETKTGEKGDSIFPTDRGFWKEGQGYFYKKIGSEVIRDKVVSQVGNRYYNFVVRVRNDNTTTGITSKPTLDYGSSTDGSGGDANWELLSAYQTLVADTVFASNANIGGFITSSMRLVSQAIAYMVEYLGSYDSSKWYVYEDNKPYTVRYRGSYSSSATYTYSADYVIDIVLYNSVYYAVKQHGASFSNIIPTNTAFWRLATDEEKAVASKGTNGTLTIDHQLIAPKNVLVEYSGEYYVINQKKNTWFKGSTPSSTSTYWRVASSEERKVVDEGVNGVVYMRYLNLDGLNGIIEVLHSDGYKWEVTQQGIQILGLETSRHIEIDPSKKEIRIYNDSGVECSNFNGDSYTTIDSIFGSVSATFSLTSSKSDTGRLYGTSGKSTTKAVTKVLSNAPRVEVGRITIQGSISAYSSRYQVDPNTIKEGTDEYERLENQRGYYIDGYGNYYDYDYVKVCLYVRVYSNSACTRIVSSSFVASIYAGGEQKKNTSNFSRTVNVASGYARLELDYEIDFAPYNYGGAQVYWDFSGGTAMSYSNDFYLSRVFANGFAYGNNKNNIVASVKESYGMHFKAVSNDAKAGLEVTYDGAYRWYRGFKFRIPVVLLAAWVKSGNSPSMSIIQTFDGSYANNFTISRHGDGWYRITWPETWKSGGARGLAIATYNTMVTLTGYSTDAHDDYALWKPTLKTINSNMCEVIMADDNTANDGDFFIKVEYFSS